MSAARSSRSSTPAARGVAAADGAGRAADGRARRRARAAARPLRRRDDRRRRQAAAPAARVPRRRRSAARDRRPRPGRGRGRARARRDARPRRRARRRRRCAAGARLSSRPAAGGSRRPPATCCSPARSPSSRRAARSTAVRVLSRASSELARGELMQRADAWQLDVTVERYLERCRLKTAVLFRAACELGALEGGGRRRAARRVRRADRGRLPDPRRRARRLRAARAHRQAAGRRPARRHRHAAADRRRARAIAALAALDLRGDPHARPTRARCASGSPRRARSSAREDAALELVARGQGGAAGAARAPAARAGAGRRRRRRALLVAHRHVASRGARSLRAGSGRRCSAATKRSIWSAMFACVSRWRSRRIALDPSSSCSSSARPASWS